MKIAVYAISKNEEKFVEKFYESAKNADIVIIADTGSTDNTVNIAKTLSNIQLHHINIKPWRFDDARNAALALIPSDIDVCISLDLDEVLTEGWRDIVEKHFKDGVNKLKYLYDWGSGVRFKIDKIHSRFGYRWKYPCHEVLVPDARTIEKTKDIPELLIEHYPDNSKSRGAYLELLKCGTQEMPHDARISFYYGRELYFKQLWDFAITELSRYVELPSAKWNAEKAFAMRIIAKCLIEKKDYKKALTWIEKGIKIAPERRESWYYLAYIKYLTKEWKECLSAAEKTIKHEINRDYWPNEPIAWGASPFDYAAISAFHCGKKDLALKYGSIAVAMNPNDQRLLKNLEWYQKD